MTFFHDTAAHQCHCRIGYLIVGQKRVRKHYSVLLGSTSTLPERLQWWRICGAKGVIELQYRAPWVLWTQLKMPNTQ